MAAVDIAPELIQSIKEQYREFIRNDTRFQKILIAIQNGSTDYKQANKLAIRVGDALSRSYKVKVSSDVLPDGKMYYNIAKRLIEETIQEPFETVRDACDMVQSAMNAEAGIGIKPQTVKINQDRLDGLIERISSEDLFDNVEWILDEPVINFFQSEVGDSVMENAKFASKAGVGCRITRHLGGNACKWCQGMAGVYDYSEKTYQYVNRFHERCRCYLTFDYSGGGSSWTKIKK